VRSRATRASNWTIVPCLKTTVAPCPASRVNDVPETFPVTESDCPACRSTRVSLEPLTVPVTLTELVISRRGGFVVVPTPVNDPESDVEDWTSVRYKGWGPGALAK
jgi:hypothetical protein